MKVLALIAHPKMEDSRVHRVWAKALERSPSISVRYLYTLYPSWRIDVQAEQRDLASHDRIILQFPFFLYGCPPLLKKWLDEVMAFRWAYGPGGTALKGKDIMVATSTGGPSESYQSGGYHNFRVEELLLPFHQIANLVGARYLNPYVLHKARTVSDAEIEASAADFVKCVLNPNLGAAALSYHAGAVSEGG